LKYTPLSLPVNRVDFKLFSSRFFLDKLIELKNIQRDERILIIQEIYIESFLTAYIGTFDALLIEINQKCKLNIRPKDVNLNKIMKALEKGGFSLIHNCLENSKSLSWFSLLRESRNRVNHRGKLKVMRNYNPFLRETTIHLAFQQSDEILRYGHENYANQDIIVLFETYLYGVYEFVTDVTLLMDYDTDIKSN
jgi:hypothetical protein